MKNKNAKTYVRVLIFFSVAALGAVMIFIGIGGNLLVFDILGIIAFAVGAVLGINNLNKARMTCSHCGKPMKGAAWRYETVSAEKEYNQQSGIVYHKYTFDVTAKCPYCGELKTFMTKRTYKATENAQYRMDQYMRNLYGDELLDE